jgi:hypothetical protein
MHRAGRHRDDRFSLYARWSGDWGMGWIGRLPGVNYNKQFLMIGKEKKRSPASWAEHNAEGLVALRQTGVPPEARAPNCVGPRIASVDRPRGGLVFLGLALFGALGYVWWRKEFAA